MQNDPVLVPLFAVAIESTLGAGALTVGSISVPAVLSAATMVAGSLALAYYMQPEAPRPQQGTIPLRQPMPSRLAGFGEVRLAGYYVLYELTIQGSTPHSYDVIALCQGPAGGFKNIFLDDAVVSVDPTQGICGIPGGGAQYQGCTVNVRRGAKLESWLFPPYGTATGGWNAQCRGDRVVQMSLACASIAAANFKQVYPHGLPQPSAAVFLPCWDFRDPVQDPTNPDSWMNYPTWSSTITYPIGARVIYGGITVPGAVAGGMLYVCIAAGQVNIVPGSPGFDWCWAAVWKNPVLQAVTYLINQDFGMGLPRDKLITPSLAQLTAAAAVCDEPILLDGAAGYESRYKSNPWFKLDTEPTEVLGLIMAACDGWLSLDGNGALSVRVGKFEPPTVILDESDIISVDLSYGIEDESKVDELQLSFTSPAHGYTTQAADPWRDEEAILNRGKTRSNAFGPASVQSATQIRRLAKRIFLRTNAMHGTIVTHLGGMKCAGQRYIQVRYPLIPELDNIGIELRRRETDIANRQCRFDFVVLDSDLLEGWIPSEEEGEAPPPPIVVPPVILPVPQNVTATAITGPPYLVAVAWDDVHWPGQFMVRWRVAVSPGGPFTQMQFAAPADLGARLQVTVPGLVAGVAYEFQVASVAAGGTQSAWSASAFLGGSAFDFPNLDYSDPKNSAKWLWCGTF